MQTPPDDDLVQRATPLPDHRLGGKGARMCSCAHYTCKTVLLRGRVASFEMGFERRGGPLTHSCAQEPDDQAHGRQPDAPGRAGFRGGRLSADAGRETLGSGFFLQAEKRG